MLIYNQNRAIFKGGIFLKKKSFFKLAALTLCVFLAAGCSIPQIDMGNITEETGASQAENPKAVEISNITKPFGDAGFRVYELPDEKQYNIIDVQDGLAMIEVDGGPVITVDLSTGATAEKEGRVISDDDWARYGKSILNGFPVEIDYYEGKVTVFDKSLQIISENTIPELCDAAVFFTKDYFTWCREGNILCCGEIGEDGSIKIEETAAKLPEDMTLSYCEGRVNENELIIAYNSLNNYNSNYGILCTDTGEVVPLNISDNGYSLPAGGSIVLSECGSTSAELFNPDNPSVKKVIELPVGATLVTPDENVKSIYFYTDLPSEKEGFRSLSVYRYDISDGRLTGKITEDVPGECAYIARVCEYGDYAVLNAYIDDYDRILFWQPEEVSEPHGYTAVSGADYSDDNAKLAERIRSEYSIDIYYGNDGVRHFDSYAMVAETDEKLINNALVTLDGFLGKFPEGFFEEVIKKSSDYSKINIYLTGKIIPNLNESQSISDAAAFVTTENGCHLMVIDITQSNGLEVTVAHEFMHIIEDSMYGMYFYEEDNLIDHENFIRWSMLNPEDFEYYYSYTDEYGATINYSNSEYGGDMYYEGCGMDINSIYFVDGYSMTYPHEDRARIFENIATTAPNALPDYFKGTAMQLKAAYLCACIRESFDCITDDTVLFWESGINPEYTLEYFQSNYDWDEYMIEHAAG